MPIRWLVIHKPECSYATIVGDKFTCRTGTIFERSHIPLHKWLLATHLMAASKKGMSALQLSRMLGLPYKTAWFLCHRICESMKPTAAAPIGGDNKVVEADASHISQPTNSRLTKKSAKSSQAMAR
jgi:hypothetical protein